jgi:hypothetical protein
MTGVINGGLVAAGSTAGGDWLDYSALSTAVTANLTTAAATGFGSVVNVQNILGGNGVDTLTGNAKGNILVGGAAADTITAGTGRSLLIGGFGADTVKGGSAEDIVIGSNTNFDSNLPALSSILAEWQSSNTFAVRVSHLRNGGGLNKNNTLVADVTVHNDSAPDSITGGASADWLWGQPAELKDLTDQDISNTPINETITLAGANSLVYTAKQSATFVDPQITINTVAGKKLATATVRIGTNYSASQDNLGFSATAFTGNITASFNSSNGTLTLTSANSTATADQFQAALRQVSYWNSSTNPSTATRSVGFQVSDGATFSNTLASSISINFAPVVAGTSTVSYTGGQGATVINSVITVSDADNSQLASATVKFSTFYSAMQDSLGFVGNASTGDIVSSFNSSNGTLTLTSASGTGTLAQYQAALRQVTYVNSSPSPFRTSRTVAYQVSDTVSQSNVVTSTITIN